MRLFSRSAAAAALVTATCALAQAPAAPPPPPLPPVGLELIWAPGGVQPPQGSQVLVGGLVAGQPGGPLPVCRAAHQNGVHPGKFWQGKCNIGWGGQEVAVEKFEILVFRPAPNQGQVSWVDAGGQTPPNAVVGGQEPGRQLGVCRTQAPNGWHPGKLIDGRCSIGFGGREVIAPQYQVLVQARQTVAAPAQPPAQPAPQPTQPPVAGAGVGAATGVAQAQAPSMPPPPPQAPAAPPPPPLPPVGLELIWAPGGVQPPQGSQALVGGFVAGGGPLLVCRAAHQNGVHPGKFWQGKCNIGWGGQEVAVEKFEILVFRPAPNQGQVSWVDAGGQTPPNAVVGGKEPGRQLGVCRTLAPNGWHPGKLIDGRCSIGFGGREVVAQQHQVLVQTRQTVAAPAQPPATPAAAAPVQPSATPATAASTQALCAPVSNYQGSVEDVAYLNRLSSNAPQLIQCLNPFQLGFAIPKMTAAQLAMLTPDQVGSATARCAAVSNYQGSVEDPAYLNQLASSRPHQAIQCLNPFQLGFAIPKMTAAQLGMLTAAQVGSVTARCAAVSNYQGSVEDPTYLNQLASSRPHQAIQCLNNFQLGFAVPKMTPAQIGMLTVGQIQGLSDVTLRNLNPPQRAALSR